MKKVVSGALKVIVGLLLLGLVAELFREGLGSITGGTVQASGLVNQLRWEGVIGPLEITMIGFVVSIALVIIAISGLVGMCAGGLEMIGEAVGATEGSGSGKGIGFGWLVLLIIIGLIVLFAVVPAVKKGAISLQEISDKITAASASIAAVDLTAVIVAGALAALLVFGVVGFSVAVVLLLKEIF